MSPKNAVPFLRPGRLVKVDEPHRSWGWGVIVNFHRPKFNDQPFIVDVLLHCASGSEVRIRGEGGGGGFQNSIFVFGRSGYVVA